MGHLSQCCQDPSRELVGPSSSKFRQSDKRDKMITADDFKCLNYLGEGKFGKVMKVRKNDTGQVYAMKLISKKKLAELGLVQNTFLEKEILKRFDNPFLVKLNFSFQSTRFLYLIMEYMDGGDLYYILKKEGYFSQDMSKLIFAQVLLAINFLHTKHVMYRDLKPENVLIHQSGHIKITDFGLSKVEGHELSYTLAGTADYIAPEILNGKGYNHLIDLWSLGVLLYEMTHGYPPFNSAGEDIRTNIINCKYKINAPISGDCADLIRKLLQLEAGKRLGAKSIEDIKEHKWLRDVEWESLTYEEGRGPLADLYGKYDKIREVKCEPGRINVSSQSYSLNIQNFTYDPSKGIV